VLLWNEYGSTKEVEKALKMMRVSREKRTGELDDLAAVVILQSYLDAQTAGSEGFHENQE
jgi:RNase H-fold protein (predicted Holliday junction resolvase)